MSTEKRLARYALTSKGTILFALIMLSIAVSAELTGPFIAKTIIDRHISGIEQPWYESETNEHSVQFDGNAYTREAYLPEHAWRGDEVQILQIGTGFYFTREPLPTEGERTFENGVLSIQQEDVTYTSAADTLTTQEVLSFYEPEIGFIVRWLLLYLSIVIIAAFFHYGKNFYLQKAAHKIIQRMRVDVFNHLSKVPVRYFDHQPAGKIVARITNDTEAVRELYMTVLATFFSSFVYIIGIYFALFLLDVRLAFMTLAVLPLLFIWFKLYRKFAARLNRTIRAKNADINASLNENVQGMSMIQAFNQEEQQMDSFDQLNNEHYRAQANLLNVNSLTGHNLTFVLKNIVFVALIWWISGGTAGLVTLGVLYAFVDYVNRLFEPVNQVMNQLANLEQARAAGSRVFELLDEDGADVDDTSIPRPTGEVAFHTVSFSYVEGEPVLQNISFQAKPGETIALVGHTGSGKSSIMNLLFRFYDPTNGRITIDGVNTKNYSPQALRAHMGIVLQEPHLFSGTIASNIAYGKPDASKQEIEEAIRLVGGSHLFKNGLDEIVTEKGSTLSSGQRQLISFARALLANPAILVLDEATSSVDTETERIIQTGLQTLKQNRTTFMIAHRLSTIQDASHIIVLDKGIILEQGTHNDLLRKNGHYAHLYKLQQGQVS
ncbi:ABC transporter ATP-binding protein/permease [Alkalihalobacillus sp. LMS6]|uniref:ABC transporter ATP-binding protein n=1 Tax=Alkalihalobacillus sp. LMS6 TaxID=2924034 RepID=UPI0020D1081B|nr:ABC transporter ATP-binding protein [Alkalihalobacillus sp. LMS6]UTR05969.1 ABC transporter ATP-binding protein/permease [Alkalihalobacillus sp. LMS6]